MPLETKSRENNYLMQEEQKTKLHPTNLWSSESADTDTEQAQEQPQHGEHDAHTHTSTHRTQEERDSAQQHRPALSSSYPSFSLT